MKKEHLRLGILWGLALLCIFALSPIAGAEEIYSSVIRIHVIANSDSDEDQALKLKVRDRILEYAKEELAGTDMQDAAKKIRAGRKTIKALAEEVIREEGYDYPAEIDFSKENYPTRHYEGISLPAGNYLSLQIRIGSGEGKNWWCVLFPPVCLDSATEKEDALLAGGMSEENIKTVELDGREYELRFRTLEWIQGVREKISAVFS